MKVVVNKTEKLVSIGMPIRNGASTLRFALDSIINQTHKNLEIIISDNCSCDETSKIVFEYKTLDSRIKYYRQDNFLTVVENFRFVLDKSVGDFFMWAAHDDRRNTKYISQLLKGFTNDSKTILVFGDSYSTPFIEEDGVVTQYNFDNKDMPRLQRLKKAVDPNCMHLYGLWKSEVLKKIKFYPCVWAWDQPVLPAAAYLGEFKYVAGPKFIYLTIVKSHEQRAVYQDGKVIFNKYISLAELLLAMFKTCTHVGGPIVGVYGVYIMFLQHAKNLPKFIKHKLKKNLPF